MFFRMAQIPGKCNHNERAANCMCGVFTDMPRIFLVKKQETYPSSCLCLHFLWVITVKENTVSTFALCIMLCCMLANLVQVTALNAFTLEAVVGSHTSRGYHSFMCKLASSKMISRLSTFVKSCDAVVKMLVSNASNDECQSVTKKLHVSSA